LVAVTLIAVMTPGLLVPDGNATVEMNSRQADTFV
jgi:hypothetical protein